MPSRAAIDGTDLYFRSEHRVSAGRRGSSGAHRPHAFWSTPHEPRHSCRCAAGCANAALDAVTLLVMPGVLFVLALFIYPFLYGLVLSFTPKEGGALANYVAFFSDPFLYDTIYTTLVDRRSGHGC